MSNIDSSKEREKLAKLKDLICSCGVGYGSLEDHPDWCLASDLIGTIRHLRNVIDDKDAEIEMLQQRCESAEKLADRALDKDGAKSARIIKSQRQAEEAEAALARTARNVDALVEDYDQLSAENRRLRLAVVAKESEIERLREAVMFYADNKNWNDGKLENDQPNTLTLVPSSAMRDCGSVARAALNPEGGT